MHPNPKFGNLTCIVYNVTAFLFCGQLTTPHYSLA